MKYYQSWRENFSSTSKNISEVNLFSWSLWIGDRRHFYCRAVARRNSAAHQILVLADVDFELPSECRIWRITARIWKGLFLAMFTSSVLSVRLIDSALSRDFYRHYTLWCVYLILCTAQLWSVAFFATCQALGKTARRSLTSRIAGAMVRGCWLCFLVIFSDFQEEMRLSTRRSCGFLNRC